MALALRIPFEEAERRISSREITIWQVACRVSDYAQLAASRNAGEVDMSVSHLLGGETVTLKAGEYRRKPRRFQPRTGQPNVDRGSVGSRAAAALGLKVVPRA